MLFTMIAPLAQSLVLTGGIVSVVCDIPFQQSLLWPQLIQTACIYVLVAALVHAFAVWAICKAFSERIQLPIKLLILRLWMCAAWLPLLSILIRERSIWAASIPPLIAIHAFLFMKREQPAQPSQDDTSIESGEVPSLFYRPEPPSFLQTALPPLATAIALQAGLVGLLLGRYLSAGFFFALCTVLPIWAFPVKPQTEQASRKARPSARSLLTGSLLAILLTGMALVPFLKAGRFAGGMSSLLGAHRKSTAESSQKPQGNSFSGVVLYLPAKPVQKTAPPAPVAQGGLSRMKSKPTVIPFDGPYWYFKQPDPRPRPDARVVHGDPTKANVHSTDFRPLSMEAHQYLGEPLKMDCCSAIRVALQNADDRQGEIAIEVLLSDPSNGIPSKQSLGNLVLPSSAMLHVPLNRPPVDEVLTFSFPPDAHGKQFSEITVVIRPAKGRSQAGAHVAVQHFVLVP
jgi:hypothetical protein